MNKKKKPQLLHSISVPRTICCFYKESMQHNVKLLPNPNLAQELQSGQVEIKTNSKQTNASKGKRALNKQSGDQYHENQQTDKKCTAGSATARLREVMQ